MAEIIKDTSNNTRYKAVDNDRLTVKIGGNTDYFAPSVNFSYKLESGSEQYFLNICDDKNQVRTDSVAETLSGDKLSVKAGDVESTFERIGNDLKIERVFYKIPTVAPRYKLLHSIGLSFHYQPELTEEEKRIGVERPDKYCGSYAIICDKRNHFIRKDGSTIVNYRDGLIGYIYSPYWADANDDKIKGTQEIKDGVLSYPLPAQEWLNNAALPIRLDPPVDVGYSSIGGASSAEFTAAVRGNILGPGGVNYTTNAGTLDSIYVYGSTLVASQPKAAVYDVNGSGVAVNLVDSCTITTLTTTDGWRAGTLTAAIPAGNYAMLFAWTHGLKFFYTMITGAKHIAVNSFSGTLANPSSYATATGALISMYFTYVEGSAAPLPTGLTGIPSTDKIVWTWTAGE